MGQQCHNYGSRWCLTDHIDYFWFDEIIWSSSTSYIVELQCDKWQVTDADQMGTKTLTCCMQCMDGSCENSVQPQAIWFCCVLNFQIDPSRGFHWLIREISESCCKSESMTPFELNWQIMLHWLSQLVQVTIWSYTMLWLFNEKIMFFQAELFMLCHVLKPIKLLLVKIELMSKT